MRCSDAPEATAPATRLLAASTAASIDGHAICNQAGAAFDLLAHDSEQLGLAVSGGSDSLALLHLAHDWAKRRKQTLRVASVDHGLRPEAAAEAAEVGRVCASLGVAHTILTWTPEGRTAQEDTRHARHSLLAAWAREHRINTLALGHTQDDRLETFLMRTRAGSGWWGLASPAPSSASPADPHLRLVRPLLAFPRQTLRDFLTARGVNWIDDPSNAATRFERVRMRALVSHLAPEARASALRTMNRLALLRASVTHEAAGLLPHTRIADGRLLIALAPLAEAGAVARLRFIETAVRLAGDARRPPPLAPLEKFAAAIGADEKPVALPPAVNVGGALLRAARDADGTRVLAIGREPPRRGSPPPQTTDSPDWTALVPLLADPRLAALAV